MRGLVVRNWAKSVGKTASQALLLTLGIWVAALSAARSARAADQSSSVAPRPVPLEGRIFREIRDANSGACWLLVRDAAHPGGPGRLLLAEKSPIRKPGDQNAQSQTGARQAAEFSQVLSLPVIRAGDRLMVEEKTPTVEVHLEAVALGPAVVGAEFDARLKIGGKLVRVLAQGPGRATLQTKREVRP